jgi:hypothetical protein
MSILKNDSNNLHTDMTIAVFPDDARIPTTANGNFGTVKYLQFKNRRLSASTNDSLWYPGGGDSLLIKCELDENATGTIFGTSYNSNGIQLIIENKTIKWMRNGALMKSVAWSEGVHTIGWVSAANDTSNPYYDGVVDTNVSLSLSHHSVGASIGALATLSGTTTSYSEYLTSSASWAIRIHEVLAFSYKENVDENMDKRWYHLYAATNLSATEYGMFETRTHLKFFVNAPTDQGSVSVGDRYQYGVQLFDLKTVFGSRYKDMMGIITEPGTLDGIDTECGWTADTADVMSVVSNSGVTRNFVFHVGNNAQDSLPLPSGWTPSYAGAITYEKGELHRGRKPLWSIWNDAIRFGKYAVTLQSGMQKMKFNILRRNNGDLVSKVLLEDFDGYDTSKNYPPTYEWNGKVVAEFHNGVMCTLDREHALSGGYDSLSVFAMNRELQGTLGFVKLGNLPLWNYSVSQQAVAGIDKLSSIGGGLKLAIYDPSAPVGQQWKIMGTIFKTSADTGDLLNGLPKLLSSDSSEATKNLFKYNGIDCTGYFRKDSVLGFIRSRVLEKGSRKIKASMVLVSDVGDMPADNKLVDCSDLVLEREGEMTASFNPRNGETTYVAGTLDDDRFIVGEQDGIANIGTTEYLIGIQSNTDRVYQKTPISIDKVTGEFEPSMGFALALGYALKNKNSGALLKMFGTGATTVFGYVEVTEESKTIEDKSSSIVHTTIPGEDYDYNVYTLAINSNFTSADVRSHDEVVKTENPDGSVKFEISFVIPASSEVHRDSIECSIVDELGYTTILQYDYIMSGVLYEDTPCKIDVVFTNVGANAQIQLTSYMDTDSESAEASLVYNRKIQNRFYGFTKPIKNDSGDTTIQEDYFYPFAYISARPEWRRSDVAPFGLTADRTNGEMGALFFMWKDLYGNTNVNQNRPTYPFTAHMRLFSTANGPHAWDLYGPVVDSTNHRLFDGAVSENPYFRFTVTEEGVSKYIKYMFHNHDRLIPYNPNDNNTFMYAYMSVWKHAESETTIVDENQVTDGAEAWVGRTINIYKGPLHEPKDGPQTKTPLCSFGPITADDITNGIIDSTSGRFRCSIDSNVTYYECTNFPTHDGYSEYGHTGMFLVKVIRFEASEGPTPGTMYYIDIV